MWYSVGILPYPNEPPRGGLSLGAGALWAPKRGAEPPLHAKQPVQRNAEPQGYVWRGALPPRPAERRTPVRPGRPRGPHLFSLM